MILENGNWKKENGRAKSVGWILRKRGLNAEFTEVRAQRIAEKKCTAFGSGFIETA
jgi:hypothetical protein